MKRRGFLGGILAAVAAPFVALWPKQSEPERTFYGGTSDPRGWIASDEIPLEQLEREFYQAMANLETAHMRHQARIDALRRVASRS